MQRSIPHGYSAATLAIHASFFELEYSRIIPVSIAPAGLVPDSCSLISGSRRRRNQILDRQVSAIDADQATSCESSNRVCGDEITAGRVHLARRP